MTGSYTARGTKLEYVWINFVPISCRCTNFKGKTVFCRDAKELLGDTTIGHPTQQVLGTEWLCDILRLSFLHPILFCFLIPILSVFRWKLNDVCYMLTKTVKLFLSAVFGVRTRCCLSYVIRDISGELRWFLFPWGHISSVPVSPLAWTSRNHNVTISDVNPRGHT